MGLCKDDTCDYLRDLNPYKKYKVINFVKKLMKIFSQNQEIMYLLKYFQSLDITRLPKKTYFKCSVLYDFCRTIDNIADRNIDLEIK